MKRFFSFLRDDEGQTFAEYGLILVLIGAVVAGAAALLGPAISTVYDNIRTTLGG